MEINRINYQSYNTISIKTNNVMLDLDYCNIIEIKDTKYDHEKVLVELSEEKLKEMINMKQNLINISLKMGLTGSHCFMVTRSLQRKQNQHPGISWNKLDWRVYLFTTTYGYHLFLFG